jgi:epoxyqueuosine reductase QueG
MPEDVSRLNRWLHGCEVCQDVCPLNVKIKHKKEIVLSPEINLYGMRLANVATVSQKTLRDNMEHITSAGYLRYVRRLLGEGAQD